MFCPRVQVEVNGHERYWSERRTNEFRDGLLHESKYEPSALQPRPEPIDIHCKGSFFPHIGEISVVLRFWKAHSCIEAIHVNANANNLFGMLCDPFERQETSSTSYAKFDH